MIAKYWTLVQNAQNLDISFNFIWKIFQLWHQKTAKMTSQDCEEEPFTLFYKNQKFSAEARMLLILIHIFSNSYQTSAPNIHMLKILLKLKVFVPKLWALHNFWKNFATNLGLNVLVKFFLWKKKTKPASHMILCRLILAYKTSVWLVFIPKIFVRILGLKTTFRRTKGSR